LNDDTVSGLPDSVRNAAFAFRRFLVQADFLVVQFIKLFDVCGRQIGHHDVGAGQQSPFPAVWGDCSKCRRCRNQGIRKHQPQNGDQAQAKLQITVLAIPEGRVLVPDVGANPDHCRPQLLQKS
jgi:hypothetical protein